MIFGIGGLVDSPTSQALERIFGRDGMCVWPPLQSPCSFFQTLSCLDFLRNGILRVFCHRKVENFIAALVGFCCLKNTDLCFFRCRIRWEFESPVIPLLSKIAPSDVILVRRLPADSAFAEAWDAKGMFQSSEEITQVTLAICLREAGELLAFGLNLGLLEKKLGETEHI